MSAPETISIDNVKYVREDSIKRNQPAISTDGLQAVIVRSQSAGVFAGYLKEQKERVVTLHDCRRLWYWSGAFTLSEIANDGVSKPKQCKFSCCVDTHIILDASEIIPMTQSAAESVFGVPEYTA